MRTCVFLVSITLITTLLGGGFTHAAVEHDHGAPHSATETVWTTLHGALHANAGVWWVAPLLLILFFFVRSVVVFAPSLILTDARSRELHRGIVKYRRFR